MTATEPKVPTKIFISYSHKDENFKSDLVDHLSVLRRQGLIDAWQDRDIDAGDEWSEEIFKSLEAADMILLLVSVGFLASDFCYSKEMGRAMERHAKGEARVIPIILKPCDWTPTPFAKLQGLPKNAKPISTWADKDEAYMDVVTSLRKVLGKPPPNAPKRP
jgi:hypothetical protein